MSENAQLYDASVPDWLGEVEFYNQLLNEIALQSKSVLEVACGTGRIAVRLAQQGVRVVGIDLSADFLAGAHAKSAGLNVRWEQADMRHFDLAEKFDLIIIPGHSFQFMLTPADQIACLQSIQRHLQPDARLVLHLDHQDLGWLAEISGEKSGIFELTKELTHPQNGRKMRVFEAWSYEPITQTASVRTRREITESDGRYVTTTEAGPTPFHCAFPVEMQHLLERLGFRVEAVYGDFLKGELVAGSSEMIWIVSYPNPEK